MKEILREYRLLLAYNLLELIVTIVPKDSDEGLELIQSIRDLCSASIQRSARKN